MAALQILESGEAPLPGLRDNVRTLFEGLIERKFRVLGGQHPLLIVEIGPYEILRETADQIDPTGTRFAFCVVTASGTHALHSVAFGDPVAAWAAAAEVSAETHVRYLKPVFFELDSSDLNSLGLKALDENAALLKKYSSWTVTVEGHCDERGTAEYNLALGERRAIAARAYLVSLGIPADRLRTVSYGKEFPFDPGHDESAFAKNRRAHFVITAK